MISENIAAATDTTFLEAGETVFADHFDRRCFSLRHRLSDHPLFELPRLLRLADQVKRNSNNVVYDTGEVQVEHRWDQRPPKRLTLEETMEQLITADAWVILKHSEVDRDFRSLRNEIMADMSRLSGLNLEKLAKNAEAQVMLTSPNRVTPYHLDNECNVLMQIKGEKDIYIFDQTDREVLTAIELEKFWVGDWNAGEYKARWQERGNKFRLRPGAAVHIPVNAPHWVKNDNNISVSFSINFEWRDETVPNVHRANFFLRKMGLQPQPPGASRSLDRIKATAAGVGFVPARFAARGAVRFARRLRGYGLKKA
jgi:hypothetical protein